MLGGVHIGGVPSKVSNCRLIIRRERYVVVQINGGMGLVTVVSCYLAPSMAWKEVHDCLDSMREDIRALGGSVVVVGDFNAKSPLWGSPSYCSRGRVVEEWAAEIELCLLNEGNAPTCIRPQGASIIDISWCTKDIRTRIRDSGSQDGDGNLSDHVWIEMIWGGAGEGSNPVRKGREDTPQWKRDKWDFDLFRSTMDWELMNLDVIGGESIERTAANLEKVL